MRYTKKLTFLMLLVWIVAFEMVTRVEAGEVNPLATIDTSSPRSTLQGFLHTMDERYNSIWGPNGSVIRYLNSGELFPPSHDLVQRINLLKEDRRKASRYFDLSGIPRAVVDQAAWRIAVQLKEILDRLALPAIDAVPDSLMMAGLSPRNWTIPGSEITIARVETGPQAGRYLFTQDTVSQIPVFYDRIKALPYKQGGSAGMYDHVFHEPSGVALALSDVIPPRWFYSFPEWSMFLFFDQPIWRWLAIVMLWGGLVSCFWGSLKVVYKREGKSKYSAKHWTLLPAISLLLLVPAMDFVMGEVLRVSPSIYQGMTLVLWGIFYCALIWFIWITGRMMAEWLIGMEQLQSTSIDSQLIRLCLRLISAVLSIAVLVEGSDRLGLPSYSVVAGLGVGGVAVALAGQQTLANMVSSLIIMFERPFRTGQTIKFGLIEGKVEEVGFRSTRLRTNENSVITVPNSELVNKAIENMSSRKSWRIKRSLHLAIDTPIDRLKGFETAVRELLESIADVKSESARLVIVDIGLHGFELSLDFFIKESNETIRLHKCDSIFIRIAEAAASKGIVFASCVGVDEGTSS